MDDTWREMIYFDFENFFGADYYRLNPDLEVLIFFIMLTKYTLTHRFCKYIRKLDKLKHEIKMFNFIYITAYTKFYICSWFYDDTT